jgi:DNA-binding transcriptional MerR regulator
VVLDETVISALSADQVSKLTGLSKSRLFAWDRDGFFRPSFAAKNRRLPYSRIYSFEDVLALRTLAILRNKHKVSLGELRRVAQAMRKETERPWTTRRLYVFRRKVAFDEPESGRRRNIADGQFIEDCIELQSVADDIRAKARFMKERRADTVGKVERHRFVMANSWVVAGTRITTSAIKSFADEGYSTEQIIGEYPDLSPADIKAALDHEQKRAKAA